MKTNQFVYRKRHCLLDLLNRLHIALREITLLRPQTCILFGILLAAANLAASQAVNLQEARAAIDQRFADELKTLAKRCDSLKLDQQAQETRAWLIDRDPQRQYIFLPDHFESKKPPAAAPEFVRFWHKHFLSVREKHAEELFKLSKHLLEQHQPTNAFQLLHEVLRNAPNHDEARRILGYRKHLGQWRRDPVGDSTRAARVRHPMFGWAPRRYWRIKTSHFEITTNHSVKEGKKLGDRLDLLHDVWRQVFYQFWANEQDLTAAFKGEHLPKRPEKKHQVVLFRDREEYVNQMKKHVPGIEISSGYYAPERQTSYFYAGDEGTNSTCIHEATHQLFSCVVPSVPDVGVRDNFWIVEAVAMYMESLLPQHGYATLGGFDSPRLQHSRLRAFNQRFHVPLGELIQMSREDMQKDARLRALYSQSVGLAHFLMDYQSGRFRDAMVTYLRLVYSGRERIDTLETLAGVPLAELDKSYYKFLDVTDTQITRYLRNPDTLTQLVLGHTSITDAALAKLSTATKLEWLDLADTNITDKGVEHLSKAGSLAQLNIEGTRVTDRSLKVVEHLQRIERLDLSRTNITDDGLASVAALSNLKYLWLTGTKVTDVGVTLLRSLKNLESLDTIDTEVSPAGRDLLKRALPKLED